MDIETRNRVRRYRTDQNEFLNLEVDLARKAKIFACDNPCVPEIAIEYRNAYEGVLGQVLDAVIIYIPIYHLMMQNPY